MEPVIQQLLASDEPSIRYKVRVGVLGEDPQSPAMQALREEIRASPRVTALLATAASHGIYQKWGGSHWVLNVLSDLGCPPGDPAIAPLIDRTCALWLSERHIASVPVINGRPRRCTSQEGNMLYALLTLGFDDGRADRLVENILRWQWPDGGWNCDKKPEAATSSFEETWIPLRALTLYARVRNHAAARNTAARAAEVLLKRHLFRRLRDGSVITPRFLLLCYPPYWHYNILIGLKVMVEAGFINDPRCEEALDLLESKRLPDGGFTAETVNYITGTARKSNYSAVSWGGKRMAKMNEWVTAEALCVLVASGRM